MSKFEYLTALLGIVLAIAVAEILLGVGRLLRERERVKFYWVHLAWMFLILVLIVQRWWAFWQFRTAPLDSFVSFLVLAMPDFTVVIAALLVTPRPPPQATLDLREYFFRQRVFLFPILALVLLQFTINQFFIVDRPLLSHRSVFRWVGIAGLLVLAVTRSARLHAAAVIALGLLFVSYSLLFYGESPD